MCHTKVHRYRQLAQIEEHWPSNIWQSPTVQTLFLSKIQQIFDDLEYDATRASSWDTFNGKFWIFQKPFPLYLQGPYAKG